jgi:glycosyltransferase involved in cell wall biosynthesis
MSRGETVLVVGGGNVERSPDGSPTTKIAIAKYLHGLADEFGHCIWMARRSGTWGMAIAGSTEAVTGKLDESRITVVPIEGGPRHAPRNFLKLIGNLARRPYVILFLPAALWLAPLLPLVRRMARCTAVYLAGDYRATLEADAPDKWLGWRTVYRRSFEGALRHADLVIARGRYLADVAGLFNERVEETVPLAHFAVAHAPVRERGGSTGKRVLYLGLVIRAKGMPELLEALRLVGREHPEQPVRLDVVGDGPDLEAMQAQAKHLGLGDRVVWHGWVEGAEKIARVFSDSDLLVMPSSTHPEGVPRCIDEAIVHEVPVVATRIGGVADEFVDGEVILVDPGRPAELSAAICSVLFDASVRERALANASARRERWLRFPSAADQHAALLREPR